MKAINWIQANGRRSSWIHKLLTLCITFISACAFAQAPAGGGAPPPYTAAELDQLVAPIALYPDDLVALILPATTYPLEIVQADRFLDKRKTDKNLKINDAWQDSVKSLLNYPDVVKKMSTEIDWTADLGEAVAANQSGVMEAIQRFRRKVQSVGNLKSDDKQTVVVEKEVVQIVQANPEVIYVPQYNPSTVVVAGGYSGWGYYPSPYPVYYYPYAPGAAFASGLIWGAAIGAAWSNNHWGCNWGGGGNNNININRNTNISTGNINTGKINRSSGQGTAWRSDKKPGQVSSGAGRTPRTDRVGDAGRGQGFGDRQGAGGRQDFGGRQSAGGRDSYGDRGGSARDRAGSGSYGDRGSSYGDRGSSYGDRGSSYGDRGSSYGDRGGRSGDAFGGYGGGGNTRADSSRGASSRSSMSSGGGRGGSSFQGGGGGGGRAAGGGGRGGGGRR